MHNNFNSPQQPAPFRLKGPNPYKYPLMWDANAMGVAFIASTFSSSVCYRIGWLIPGFAGWMQGGASGELLDIIIYSIMFLVPIAIILKWLRIPPRVAFPMRKPKASLLVPALFIVMGASIVGSLLSELLSVFLQGTVGLTPTMPDMSAPEGTGPIALYFISTAIAPAFLEELLYRGAVMQPLRRYGDGFALVVSSVAFALAHGNLVQGPYTLVAGLVIGYFVLRSGSLWVGIAMHFANNGISVVSELVYIYGSWEMQEFFGSLMIAVRTLGALVALAYVCIRHKGMFRVPRSAYPLLAREKYWVFFTCGAMLTHMAIMIWYTSFYFE